MDEERMLILNMLRDGKITAEEAEKLLSAVRGEGKPVPPRSPRQPDAPRAPRASTPPTLRWGDEQTRREAREIGREVRDEARREAREIGREVREEARRAGNEARRIAREARRAALDHAQAARREISRRWNDEEFRSVVDEVSSGVREGMRGLSEGLDVGLREGMRGLREGMRGLREGLSTATGDVRVSGRGARSFTWSVGSDRAEAREEIERQLTPADGSVLDFSSVNGDGKIVIWDDATVKIQAVKRAWGTTDVEARSRLGQIELVTAQDGERLVIREKHPDGTIIGRPGSIDFVLYVPRTMALRLKSVNGDIACAEAAVRLDVRTINGNLELGSITEGDIGSTNGDVVIGSATGPLQVANVNGDIQLGLAPTTATFNVRNVHGDIVVALKPEAAVHIEATSRNGDITTQCQMVVEQRSAHRLSGRVGQGGGSLVLNTINGELTIK